MYTAQKGIRPWATDTVLQRDVHNRGTMEGPRREDQLRRATEEGRLKAYHQRAINAEHRSTAAVRRATHADPKKSLRPGFTITGEGPKRRFHHSQKDHEGPTRGYHPRQKDNEGPTRGYHLRQKDHEGPTRGRHVLIEDDPFWAQNGPRPRESAEWCRYNKWNWGAIKKFLVLNSIIILYCFSMVIDFVFLHVPLYFLNVIFFAQILQNYSSPPPSSRGGGVMENIHL